MIRVLLADDHPVVRTGYRRLLEQAGDVQVVAEASDGDAAYAAFVAAPPDVLVTDLSMPGGGGMELIRRVLLRAAAARVLVFSMHDSPLLVRRALEAGARGFLTKASAPDGLVVAIRALHAGQRYLGPELPAALLQPREPQPETERLATLSAREFEIFKLLAQGHSSAECAQVLRLSPKTVANHQTLIKEKLGVVTSAALAHLALRHRVIDAAGA
ncbi:response regulator [Rhizobacter fulvus]|jgi:DNA-binding NarL/FixJ family response regulator